MRSLLLPASLLLALCTGCASVSNPTTFTGTALAGNWQVSSLAAQASRLPALSGTLHSLGNQVSGILHADAASACVAPSAAFAVAGTVDGKGNVTVTGPLAGGTFTLTGALAADAKSITGASYMVAGGTCAFASAAAATAATYADITGDYAGSFSDANGQVLSITASLTQTPASDTSGNFQLSGTGSLGANSCFSSPALVSNSQVTGGSFTLTYTDPGGSNSVTASGTFSQDGKSLNVTQWTLNPSGSGTCGTDQGTGLLTRQ